MNIVFLCPPAGVINGGTKYLYRMATLLTESGHEVAMFEQNGQRPTWFETTLSVIGQGHLRPDSKQIFVLPEDQPELLASIKNWPQRKVIYAQNHFYGALGIGEAVNGYADYGVTHILCSSHTIYDHSCMRHPTLKAYVIPCAIDTAQFKPLTKRKIIAYMPRKRGIEANYLRDMFRFTYPQHRDWEWQAITDKSEAETARLLGEAKVFLSLSRLEGFGLTPLEAMAAGCVAAGFTGIGGWEYATDANGFWSDEDDFPACIAQMARAVALADLDGAALDLYHQACQQTLAPYTAETFRSATLAAWTDILATNATNIA